MHYRIIIRLTDEGLHARCPDFPTCSATGRSLDEVESKLRQAIEAQVAILQAEYRWKQRADSDAEAPLT